mmetsp:Transcript_9746/g.30047  ORF Transcript_9746/g.30047 Transcript_9746/m.30047 type:complete len:229 (-) Transcript_9746:68-754(-)
MARSPVLGPLRQPPPPGVHPWWTHHQLRRCPSTRPGTPRPLSRPPPSQRLGAPPRSTRYLRPNRLWTTSRPRAPTSRSRQPNPGLPLRRPPLRHPRTALPSQAPLPHSRRLRQEVPQLRASCRLPMRQSRPRTWRTHPQRRVVPQLRCLRTHPQSGPAEYLPCRSTPWKPTNPVMASCGWSWEAPRPGASSCGKTRRCSRRSCSSGCSTEHEWRSSRLWASACTTDGC